MSVADPISVIPGVNRPQLWTIIRRGRTRRRKRDSAVFTDFKVTEMRAPGTGEDLLGAHVID